MTSDSEFDQLLRLKVGRIGDRGKRAARSAPSFTELALRSVARHGGDPRRIVKNSVGSGRPARTGRFNARGRGARIVATLPKKPAWSFDPETCMRHRARRVVVKARVVKMRGPKSRAAAAHLRYLQRDGVTRDTRAGELYSAWEDKADGIQFGQRGRDDRHQFRLIVAAEDGAELGDLRDFTRRLMTQLERDLDTTLDWVAVDHHNTGHPHSHIVIRGVTDDSKILYVAGDYIAHGIRHRASEIVTLELGPQTEWEVQQKLGREVDQDRFTRLDRALLQERNESGVLDLRAGHEQSYLAGANRQLLIGRLRKLERMGLARETEPGRWSLSSDLERTLRDLGERGDIIKTMHRAITEGNLARSTERYVIYDGGSTSQPIVGRVIGKGLAGDEMSDQLHLVIDGTDGRVHYVEMAETSVRDIATGSIVEVGRAAAQSHAADRTITELARRNDGIYRPSQHLDFAHANVRVPGGNHEGYVEAHVRRLEALRRAGIVERIDTDHWHIPEDFERRALAYDAPRTRQLAARTQSAVGLDAQVTANAATWLDREMTSGTPLSLAGTGFGTDVRDAIAARKRWLVDQGLARMDGNRTFLRGDLLDVLARRELQQVGQKLGAERNTPFRMMAEGERITGTYKQAIELVSGKYALVENAYEFTLVPWRPVIEKELGRQVTGIMRGDGISWEFGLKRGLGIGL